MGKIWRVILLLPLVLVALIATSCTVDQTKEGRAPDIDVDMDPGRLPRYNVEWADVDVGTTTRTVTVPRLEWRREERQVEVPYIDINPPGAGEREERTITVELEVPHSGYDVQIREVRAARDELWVIAGVTETGAPRRADGPVRVSDQVVVRAPDDLRVRKVIVGQRPEGTFNRQYDFYPDQSAFEQRLPRERGRVLYQRNA